MANVAILPTPLARHAAAALNPRNANTCGVHEIAGRLGQAHRGNAYICGTINALIGEQGFPRPFPSLKAGKLCHDAHGNSRWTRAAVDAWFDNALPPEARAQVAIAERAEIDSRLNARAMRLFEDEVA